ncbi:MAG: hypothetical protein JEZ12_12975 [Desulfobacterium sp.]|nr:hypothetical protein [Desulfobacterium sp.]
MRVSNQTVSAVLKNRQPFVKISPGPTFDSVCDGILNVELAKKLGVHPSRLSEIRNYEKHKVPINEKVLASFIGGGVVTVAELKKNIPELSEDEMNELHEKNFYGDSEVKKRFASLSRKGVDVAAYLIKLDEET